MDREEYYYSKIHEYDEKYYKIISHFNLNFPKPLNLQEEKQKFFEMLKIGEIYNPQIKYNFKLFDEKKIVELKNLKFPKVNDIFGFKKLYDERLKTKIYEIECHKTWGTTLSSNYVKKYRGEPNGLLLLKAKIYCKSYKRQKVKYTRITPSEIAKELKKYVFDLTGNHLDVIFTDIQSKVNISPTNKEIKINPNEKFTSLDLKRLKVHEIGTHYIRYFNTRQYIPKILKSGTSNYIETEEGLAAYMEELMGVSSKAQIYIYAGRVIGTYYALRKSFYEVFHILKKYGFKDSDAFAITYRAKRNLCDTSLKGGFTKDYVYFSGYEKVKNYVKKNDIRDLFIGKIKIGDVKILRKFIDKNKNNIKTILDY